MYVCYFSTLWPCWNRTNDVRLFVRDFLKCRKLVFLGGLSLYFQRRRNINQVLLAINCLFSNFCLLVLQFTRTIKMAIFSDMTLKIVRLPYGNRKWTARQPYDFSFDERIVAIVEHVQQQPYVSACSLRAVYGRSKSYVRRACPARFSPNSARRPTVEARTCSCD